MLPPLGGGSCFCVSVGAERRFGTLDRRVISMPGSAGRHHCSLLLNLTAGICSRTIDHTSRPALFSGRVQLYEDLFLRADIPWRSRPAKPLEIRFVARTLVSVLTSMLDLPVPSGLATMARNRFG